MFIYLFIYFMCRSFVNIYICVWEAEYFYEEHDLCK